MKDFFKKRWVRFCIVFIFIILITYVFRHPILRGMGSYLVSEDPLVKTEAIFILGGNSYERGLEGAVVCKQFPGVPLIPTGGNIPMQLLALDTLIYEADLTKLLLVKKGVPDTLISPIPKGTSTVEESELILAKCKEKSWTDITIISSSYHLRRMRNVFEDKFLEAGITIHLHGSGSKDFGKDNWWKNEEGLIIANNEYVKLVYYWWKY